MNFEVDAPLILSVIAILISIISIRQQTKSQDTNACIQLYDKRFEIFLYILELWYIVGFFEGAIVKNKKEKKYQSVLDINLGLRPEYDISKRIEVSHNNAFKFKAMYKSLYSGNVGLYIGELLSAYYKFIVGIYERDKIATSEQEKAYAKLMELKDTQDSGIEEINDYLMLSDVKRKNFCAKLIRNLKQSRSKN